MTPSVCLALAATIVFWASSFAGIGAALAAYDPVALTLLRFITASLLFAMWAMIRRPRRPEMRDLPAILFLALVGIVAYHLLLGYGQRTVSAGAAGSLSNTSPIFTAMLGVLLLRERLKPTGWLGIALGFSGAVCIALGDGGAFRIDAGALLVLAAALCWGVYFTAQKPLLVRYGAVELMSYVTWAATGMLLPFLPGLAGTIQEASPAATLSVLYLGSFPTVVAYVAWAYTLSRVPVSFAAGFLYLIPVLSFVFAWLWLGEVPGLLTLAGVAVTLSGLALLSLKGR